MYSGNCVYFRCLKNNAGLTTNMFFLLVYDVNAETTAIHEDSEPQSDNVHTSPEGDSKEVPPSTQTSPQAPFQLEHEQTPTDELESTAVEMANAKSLDDSKASVMLTPIDGQLTESSPVTDRKPMRKVAPFEKTAMDERSTADDNRVDEPQSDNAQMSRDRQPITESVEDLQSGNGLMTRSE